MHPGDLNSSIFLPTSQEMSNSFLWLAGSREYKATLGNYLDKSTNGNIRKGIIGISGNQFLVKLSGVHHEADGRPSGLC